MSVKVGICVRPFSQKGKEQNSKLCVGMAGNKTNIFHLEDSEAKYKEFTPFARDDQLIVSQNGYFV